MGTVGVDRPLGESGEFWSPSPNPARGLIADRLTDALAANDVLPEVVKALKSPPVVETVDRTKPSGTWHATRGPKVGWNSARKMPTTGGIAPADNASIG